MDTMLVHLNASDLRNMIAELLKNEISNLRNLIENKSEQQFYTFKEVLERFDVTRPTVNKWMNSGLNYYKKGSRVYFDVIETEQFIKEC